MITLLIIFITLTYLLQEVWILEVYVDGKILHIPVKIGDHFNITYKHSVYGDEVLQVFTIGKGVMILNDIISTVRVIEYSYPNQKYELMGELAHIKSLNLIVKSFQAVGYEKLEYKDKLILIGELFTKSTIVIEIKKAMLFTTLKHIL